ncbi:2-oxoglutarate oxidoreductase subunit KorA [compost metagenome]
MTVTVQPEATLARREPLVNDFSIEVATVNGSGSQSANNILMRAIFQMGIPVSGKNLFPSNIAGLPTWFTIRANHHGYIARKADSEVFIAMNPETIQADVQKLRPGAVLIYNSDLKVTVERDDLIVLAVPFGKIAAEACPEVKLRKLVTNMVYVGVVAEILGIDMAEVQKALTKQFKGKEKAVELNLGAVKAGATWAQENVSAGIPYRLERMEATKGKIIIEGNRAAAIGCLFGGCTVVAWYPITPSSSLCENLIGYLSKYRVKDGKASFAVVQAEDELASAGMVVGAGWAGSRAMTATSGPGISLMAEFVGYAYFTEIPGVFFDVQRTGPSTGLPTRTMQGDLLSLHTLSHGDTRHPVLIPGTPKEAYEDGMSSFDLAERLQTPVFVAMDLDLGMNNWMTEPFAYPTQGFDRGKVLSAEDLDQVAEFARYQEVDGDGIPYRTLPGTAHPKAAYFTRGSGHDAHARYSERPADYTFIVDRLARKLETARQFVPQPIIDWRDAPVTLLAYGTSEAAVLEARDQLAEQGIATNYVRVRALPFSREVHDRIAKSERVYVVDQNRDGQMLQLLKLDLEAAQIGKLRSIRHYDGLPLDALTVKEAVLEMENA